MQLTEQRRSQLLQQLMKQMDQQSQHKGTKSIGEMGLRMLGKHLTKKRLDKQIEEEEAIDRTNQKVVENAIAQQLGGGQQSVFGPVRDESGAQVASSPESQKAALAQALAGNPNNPSLNMLLQAEVEKQNAPEPELDVSSSVKDWLAVSEFGKEDLGTPEARQSYLQFERDQKLANTVTVHTGDAPISTVTNLPGPQFSALEDRRKEAEMDHVTYKVTGEMLDLLDSEAGVLTGAASGPLQMVAKGLALIAEGDDGNAEGLFKQAREALANTEAYESLGGVLVGQVIRLFGSGTGLSDADREFAAQIGGAVVGKNEATLRAVLKGNQRRAEDGMKSYNSSIATIGEGIGDVETFFPQIKYGESDVKKDADYYINQVLSEQE